MPAATAIGIRREIVAGREGGESYASLSRRLQVPYVTVRKVMKHYERYGRLEPNYERCRLSKRRSADAVYEQSLAHRRAHPSWGAGVIWAELCKTWAEEKLPSVRTLQRWFVSAGLVATKTAPVQRVRVARGQQPHEVWALDAKEGMALADGSYVSWLTVSDEGSGAVLAVTLFPPPTLDAD